MLKIDRYSSPDGVAYSRIGLILEQYMPRPISLGSFDFQQTSSPHPLRILFVRLVYTFGVLFPLLIV